MSKEGMAIAGVWVRASERLPDNISKRPIHWGGKIQYYDEGSETMPLKIDGSIGTGRYVRECGVFKNCFAIDPYGVFNDHHFDNIEWLDESITIDTLRVQESAERKKLLDEIGRLNELIEKAVTYGMMEAGCGTTLTYEEAIKEFKTENNLLTPQERDEFIAETVEATKRYIALEIQKKEDRLKAESINGKLVEEIERLNKDIELMESREIAWSQRVEQLTEALSSLSEEKGDAGVKYAEGKEWVSVEDSPLVIFKEDGYWECTDNGGKEFIAAVPYNDKRQPEKQLWWIKHCVIEDRLGLCVVGDDDNDPASWEIEDVTHYWILPSPPKQQ